MQLALRASHFVDPATFELKRDVLLLIEGGRIVEVIEKGEVSGGLTGLAENTLDFEAALVMPGFVNAHAHLDLSHMHRQIPRGLSFDEWIDAVIAGRQVPGEQVRNALEQACDRLIASGTTSVIDISTDGASHAAMLEHNLSGVVALEVLGLDPAKADARMEHADAILRKIEGEDKFIVGAANNQPVQIGFSPHAPYSTSAELYLNVFGRCVGEGRVCTTHVAETLDEQQFFRIAEGPLRDFCDRLGIPMGGFTGWDESPITTMLWEWFAPWLKTETETGNPQLVLVHCNYPQGQDLDHLKRFKPTVVWCPRSHAYFGHEEWPLADMLAAGVNLCLGTDSLASNDDLDMLGEIRAAKRAQPQADLTTLFKAATINGRKVLNLGADIADLCVFGLPLGVGADASLDRILGALLIQGAPVFATICRGHVAARAL
ncbi:MAG: amidohydrolase family protein [Planctomycetes bacterium]|nr:amidohydrolase family protein [Planctomycetota bacterium]